MGGLVFDAVFEEVHESELEVTDNPIETGVVVSDHAYMKPQRLTLTAGVSDTPIRQQTNDPFLNSASRSREAYRLLQEMQAKAEPFDVQTGLKLYKNMVCTSVRTAQDKDSSNALIFTAQLREVLIVTTQTVKYTPRAGATKQQASKKAEKGEQQGTQPTQKKSIAKSLKDAGSHLFK